MKIFLLDINKQMTNQWSKYFNDKDVKVVNQSFDKFMDKNDIQCIVSPANSRGEMYGGYDLAITKYFGEQLTLNVQQYIKDNYKGLQPVGTSFIIDIPNTNKKLIHTPTMEFPSRILDYNIVYESTVNTLKCAYQNNIQSIVIPAFGGSAGKVPFETIAQLMYKAYKDTKK